tara:strand:+ start:8331 stop:9197 length:867 start_codon:yes stop_codon:yes gene_type:complete
MRIFVTGGTGFIGSHFIKQALDQGHELICLRRPNSCPKIPLEIEPKWVEGSLDHDLRDEFIGCDVFLHLASHSVNVPYDSLENCLYWNLTAPLQLMQRAREVGIRKFIVIGTAFEYGHSGERYDYIPTTANLEPSMSYPASKAAAATVFYQWSIEHNLKLQYLRLFQVYGEGESENRLWPSLKKAALSGEDLDMTEGEQLRDFIHVEDVAYQLIEALKFKKTESGKPVFKNIGTGKPSSIRQFAEYWWRKWGAIGKLNFGSIPYRDDEVMVYVPDLSTPSKKRNDDSS